jgi:signal transduction histidine kinase
MRLVPRFLAARIGYKIILPYLLLAVGLTIVIALVAMRLTVGALQERIDNRLIEAGQVTSDTLVAIEEQQITQLRPMVFTEGVAEAFAANDAAALARLLRPAWVNAGLTTLVAFDRQGAPLLSWQRVPNTSPDAPPQTVAPPDLPQWWLVQQIVRGQQDAFGDKFSTFHNGSLYTAAPVRIDGRIVGGLMVAQPLAAVLEQLERRSQAAVTTFYDAEGRPLATTHLLLDDAGLQSIAPAVLTHLRDLTNTPPHQHVQDVVSLNGREYQVAYSPLQIRRTTTGFFSVALSRQFILDAWATQRWLLAALALLMIAAMIGVGMVVARQITRPLDDLVHTARAVTNGELSRRSMVTNRDELGVVARSFNQMTERLLLLYEASRNISAQTHIGELLDTTEAAVQPLVPGTIVVALLQERGSFRYYLSEHASSALSHLQQTALHDHARITALSQRSSAPVICSAAAPDVADLSLPAAWAEVCCLALESRGCQMGVLLLLHDRIGMFPASIHAPLTAIASVAATTLHNARLFLQVQEEGNRRRVILESIADGVVVCDADRHVVLMNRAAEMLLDINDWQQQPYRFDDLPLQVEPDAHVSLIKPDVRQTRYLSHGRVLSALSAPLASAEAEAGEVIVLHDISDEVALDHAKTDLIAMISHELRTPLTGVLGSVDLLARGFGGQLSPLQTELADAARRQGRVMSALIDKAVAVANIETGSLQLDLRATSVRAIVDAALQAINSEVPTNLHLDIPDELPPVIADTRMLKLAVEQVIDNAFKYGNGAAVTIAARETVDGVDLVVRDEGPGIAPDDVPHLFSKLQRGADSYNRAGRGLGLGLVITREVIERQGGTVQVESQPDRGCEFTISLQGAGYVAQPQIA